MRYLEVWKHICSVLITSCSVAKLDQVWAPSTSRSNPCNMLKRWHDECCSMLSIAHRSVFTSECKAVSRLLKFRVPMSWIFPKLSFQNHSQPLNCAVEVHEPSTVHILSRLMTWSSSLLSSCGAGMSISFALNQAWHSLSAYRTSSKGFLSILLKSLSF